MKYLLSHHLWGQKQKRAILSEWLAVGSRDVSVSYGAMP